MQTGYTYVCDYWSMGVIMYEMLMGESALLERQAVRQRVLNFLLDTVLWRIFCWTLSGKEYFVGQ